MIPRPYSCLNGRFVLHDRAAIPVADRGFRFGDGLFESIRIVKSVPYQWEFHLSRLMEGLAALQIGFGMYDLQALVRTQLQKNEQQDGYLRIAVSRGVGSRGYRPHPLHGVPTLVIESLAHMPSPDTPYTLWLSKLARPPLASLPAHFKLSHGINNTLALLEAEAHGAHEALMLSTAGELCEAASANIFWFRDGTLFTPSLDTGCLKGSTRDALLRLSPAPVRTVQSGIQALEDAEAVWITNSRLGIFPVHTIEPMGYRYDIHTMTRTLQQALNDDMARYAKANAKEWA